VATGATTDAGTANADTGVGADTIVDVGVGVGVEIMAFAGGDDTSVAPELLVSVPDFPFDAKYI